VLQQMGYSSKEYEHKVINYKKVVIDRVGNIKHN
jgi:hypothetical protein